MIDLSKFFLLTCFVDICWLQLTRIFSPIPKIPVDDENMFQGALQELKFLSMVRRNLFLQKQRKISSFNILPHAHSHLRTPTNTHLHTQEQERQNQPEQTPTEHIHDSSFTFPPPRTTITQLTQAASNASLASDDQRSPRGSADVASRPDRASVILSKGPPSPIPAHCRTQGGADDSSRRSSASAEAPRVSPRPSLTLDRDINLLSAASSRASSTASIPHTAATSASSSTASLPVSSHYHHQQQQQQQQQDSSEKESRLNKAQSVRSRERLSRAATAELQQIEAAVAAASNVLAQAKSNEATPPSTPTRMSLSLTVAGSSQSQPQSPMSAGPSISSPHSAAVFDVDEVFRQQQAQEKQPKQQQQQQSQQQQQQQQQLHPQTADGNRSMSAPSSPASSPKFFKGAAQNMPIVTRTITLTKAVPKEEGQSAASNSTSSSGSAPAATAAAAVKTATPPPPSSTPPASSSPSPSPASQEQVAAAAAAAQAPATKTLSAPVVSTSAAPSAKGMSVLAVHPQRGVAISTHVSADDDDGVTPLLVALRLLASGGAGDTQRVAVVD